MVSFLRSSTSTSFPSEIRKYGWSFCLGLKLFFVGSLFSSFAKVSAGSFLSGSLYWRRKTKKKGERGIFNFIVLSYANQSLSLPCIALPFIWCCRLARQRRRRALEATRRIFRFKCLKKSFVSKLWKIWGSSFELSVCYFEVVIMLNIEAHRVRAGVFLCSTVIETQF